MDVTSPKLLIIDDDPDVLLAAKLLLKRTYSHIRTENDPYRLNSLLKDNRFDLVLLDMNFRAGASNGQEGIQWMKKIRRQSPETAVILMTAYGDIDLAVQAMKEGATDFVVKPWENAKFLESISQALEREDLPPSLPGMEPTPSTDFQVIGESPAMQKVFETIEKVSKTDVNVLILGENGTGKEVIAQALHHASLRRSEAFVAVDLGAIPESLFEAELFGHKKGAFTDAKEDRAGRFEHARKGTLFLDEIGNLSLPLQAKLLTVLQRREIVRVGTNKAIPMDIRLICATNMPLHQMVHSNQFRQDLLYRINTVELKLPPLRERVEDIAPLAHHFLQLYGQKYRSEAMKIHPGALRELEIYPWPGNIRELQHAIERAVIMAESSVLNPSDFMLAPAPMQNKTSTQDSGGDNNLNLEEVEKQAIREAILKHNGNLSRAARELGLGRTTLYRKLSKYGL